MSDDQCYCLTGVDGGYLPDGYPLILGSICKPVNGDLPRNVWNDMDKAWVALIWTPCDDPSEATA